MEKTLSDIMGILNTVPDLNQKRIYIWGTGNTASLYQEGLNRISDKLVVEGYVDNNSSKWGKEVFSKKCISSTELSSIDNVCVLICSPQPNVYKAVSKQLSDMNIEWYHIDAAIWSLFKNDIVSIYNWLADDISRKLFINLMYKRIICELPNDDMVYDDPYFSLEEFSRPSEDETFIDCGAYIGDTLEAYIAVKEGFFNKVICFEPDEVNFLKLVNKTKNIILENNKYDGKIELYQFAIGDKSIEGFVESYSSNNGLGSKIILDQKNDSKKCVCVKIDDFIKEKYDFLKADIESFEYRMLLGAEKSIRKYTPKLAICIYHNAVDFVTIPLLIKKINPVYNLKIRHHLGDLSETVLYAYV